MTEIESLLKGLEGVIEIKIIPKHYYSKINKLEKGYKTSLFIAVKNYGVKQVLRRDKVYAVLKNKRFRKAPKPTIYLVEENDAVEENFIVFDREKYKILGEEILNERAYEEPHFKLSDTFIIFPNRRTTLNPSYFILPPIPFPELEDKKDALGIDNIVSASPCPLSDEFIRNLNGFPKKLDYATILVGFDSKDK